MKISNYAIAALIAVSSPIMMAQDEFDFSGQRGEIQNIKKVPGKVIDRGPMGIVINPTPQKMTFDENKTIELGKGFSLKVPQALRHAVPALSPNIGKGNAKRKDTRLNVTVSARGA